MAQDKGVRNIALGCTTLLLADREGLRRQTYSCKQCASCREWHWSDPNLPGFEPGVTKSGFVICPVFRHKEGFESDYARGKVRLAEGLIDGKLPASPRVTEKLFECTQCASCSEYCPQTRVDKLDPSETIRAARGLVVELGAALPRGLESMTHRPPRPRPLPGRWIPEAGKGQSGAPLAFFPGCVFGDSFKQPSIAHAMLAILEHLGEPFQVLSEGWCCGYPAFAVGDTGKATDLARQAATRLEALGVRSLVVSCAWGYRMFSREYSVLLGRPLGVEVLHATEFLERQIVAGRLRPGKSWETLATYQDPCQLGRRCGVYEPPRSLARSIPGLTLVEMEENREAAMCSGGGGGVAAAYPELAAAIGSTRLEQAESTGARVILTACPYCRSNLLRAVAHRGSSLQVVDVIEAVAMSSGLTDPAAFETRGD